jgi:hypothetical protein
MSNEITFKQIKKDLLDIAKMAPEFADKKVNKILK